MDLMTIGFVAAAAIAVVEAIMLLKRPKPQETPSAAPATPAAPAAAAGAPRQEVVAAVSAALAEELGTDITRIRIKSITKI